jgi:hypothetical protein
LTEEMVDSLKQDSREIGKKPVKPWKEASLKFVYVLYEDHVLFNRCSPLSLKPQTREAIGWLNYECEDYIILSWDRDAEPPTLKGGDPKASGLVLLKSAILELKTLKSHALPLKESSECHLNCSPIIVQSEYALQPKKRKTRSKTKGEMAT